MEEGRCRPWEETERIGQGREGGEEEGRVERHHVAVLWE